MSAKVTRNSFADTEVVDPTKDDGSRYRFEMIFDSGRSRAYADTAADLVDVLVPGYAALDAEAKIAARVRYVTDMLASVQAAVLNAHDQSDLTPEERAILLQPRFEPVVVDEWSSEVPLVLADVHYAPYSDLTPPMSTLDDVADPRNLIWLRAGEEFALLTSLARIGYISLGENTEFVV